MFRQEFYYPIKYNNTEAVHQEGARRDGADAGAGERARVPLIGWAPSWALVVNTRLSSLVHTHAW